MLARIRQELKEYQQPLKKDERILVKSLAALTLALLRVPCYNPNCQNYNYLQSLQVKGDINRTNKKKNIKKSLFGSHTHLKWKYSGLNLYISI